MDLETRCSRECMTLRRMLRNSEPYATLRPLVNCENIPCRRRLGKCRRETNGNQSLQQQCRESAQSREEKASRRGAFPRIEAASILREAQRQKKGETAGSAASPSKVVVEAPPRITLPSSPFPSSIVTFPGSPVHA